MLLDDARRLLITTGGVEDRSSRALSRMIAVGTLIRLRPGVHVDAEVWAKLRHEERLQLRILALADASRSRPVFSHWSAAVLHGEPVPRRACDVVDVAAAPSRNRVLVGVRAHVVALRDDDVEPSGPAPCSSSPTRAAAPRGSRSAGSAWIGVSAADVVIREKNRENRTRGRRPRFARWDWVDLMGGRLERILLDAGVPKRSGRR